MLQGGYAALRSGDNVSLPLGVTGTCDARLDIGGRLEVSQTSTLPCDTYVLNSGQLVWNGDIVAPQNCDFSMLGRLHGTREAP